MVMLCKGQGVLVTLENKKCRCGHMGVRLIENNLFPNPIGMAEGRSLLARAPKLRKLESMYLNISLFRYFLFGKLHA